jgi:hypothetical protein
MAGAYGLDYMPALKRTVNFDKDAGVTTVTDAYTFTDGAHEVHERFITRGEVTLGNGTVTVKVGEETMTMTFDPAFTAQVLEASYTRGAGEDGAAKVNVVKVIDLAVKADNGFTATFTFNP